jgi:hypothetical protein
MLVMGRSAWQMRNLRSRCCFSVAAVADTVVTVFVVVVVIVFFVVVVVAAVVVVVAVVVAAAGELLTAGCEIQPKTKVKLDTKIDKCKSMHGGGINNQI